MEIKNARGTRDFSGRDAILRNKIVSTLKGVFEVYGYSPLETPNIERYDILSSKYAGGAEILKETFRFKDQGKRELGLRYDLTVPMCRYISMNPNIKLPFKRYAVGDVFRDGPIEKARYRQFTQCDVDVVGVSGMTADAEILALTQMAFKKLGFDTIIKFNNRKLLNDLLLSVDGFKKTELEEAILSIDKYNKIGKEGVRKELKEKGFSKKAIDNIFVTLFPSPVGSTDRLINVTLSRLFPNSEGLKEIKELRSLLKILKVKAEFDISLARGLSYYTGTIMEVYLKNSAVKSSVCAGGRYDNMIGSFLGKGNYPAVGVSFGLDRIYDAYVEKNKIEQKTVTKVYIIPISTFKDSLKIAEELRDEDVNIDIDLSGKGPSKNLQYANALGIPYVLFVGKEELKQGKVKLKDMSSGKEKLMSAKELVLFLQKI